MKRTHYAGNLNASHRDERVVVMGWVQHRRDHGGCIFIDLRDRAGLVQVMFDASIDVAAHAAAGELRPEWVIGVAGCVRSRGGNVNPRLKNGDIEVAGAVLHIFSRAKTPPFPIDDSAPAGEEVRLQYRYLDLRRPQLQKNLALRHTFLQGVRTQLDARGFLEVETPFLVRSTPGGARDYVVPSRTAPGKFFALPQSPQLFKQLLMVAGFDRYFQVARCFRDEDLRADRQPEFTQIDLEMSFCAPAEVQDVVEDLLAGAWQKLLGVTLQRPFLRMRYDEAMARFGVDAPDLRFGLELVDLNAALADTRFAAFADVLARGRDGAIKGIALSGLGPSSRRDFDDYAAVARTHGAQNLTWIRIREDGSWQSPVAKFLTEAERAGVQAALALTPGQVAVLMADATTTVHRALGQLRLYIARRHNLIDPAALALCWVTDFPLFEPGEGPATLKAAHHPFTAPRPEHAHLLGSDPAAMRAQAYDIVLNGVEIGGGSMRMHDAAQQRQVLRALGLSDPEVQTQFGFLLEALDHGAPPHGGVALGVDRICMLMCQAASIRDVIAFPKTQRQTDLMLDAPAQLAHHQLDELCLQVRQPPR